jgi:hypothetical protein
MDFIRPPLRSGLYIIRFQTRKGKTRAEARLPAIVLKSGLSRLLTRS